VLFPRYSGDTPVQFARIADSLFKYDQFDDWLPDPVYYQDRADDLASTVKRAEAVWSANTAASFEPETLDLPRASGQTVPAVALPIDVRLCAHALITVMAPRIAAKLRRDKVYGFRFLRQGSRVFDRPGGELANALALVADAAKASNAGTFELLDIVNFNASASPDRLAQTLKSCDARPDEAHAISTLAALGGRGLASVDDAFACAYNFYLQPIDEELFQAKLNFFRYRDEYFVFDPAAGVAVRAGAQRLGLVARSKGPSKDVHEAEASLGKGGGRQWASEVLLKLPNGSIRGVLSCPPSAEDCTDRFEMFFEREEPGIDWLFERPAYQLVDAIDVLPVLRSVHRRRRGRELLAPPFGDEARVFAAYRSGLAKGRAWLAEALDTAIRLRSSWQAGWCATLLSDLGALSEAETQLVKRAATSALLKESAKAQARIALARSSTLGEGEFWGMPGAATEFQRRATLTAARLLARRFAEPWNAARASLGAQEPELVRHLTANIQGTA
jgi:hypothetical protein